MIKLIVALGPNNLIGNKNRLPWQIKEELEHFKKTTLHSWLFMGGNTYKSLPKKLDNRKMCVISPDKFEGIDFQVKNAEEAKAFLSKFKNSDEDVFIAGGKMVYESFYTEAEELIVSYIKRQDYRGDSFLDWDLSQYQSEAIQENEKFQVIKYRKRS